MTPCPVCGRHVDPDTTHHPHHPECPREGCDCDLSVCERCCWECVVTRRPFPDRAVAAAAQTLFVATAAVCHAVFAVPELWSQARAAGWVARHLNHRRHQS